MESLIKKLERLSNSWSEDYGELTGIFHFRCQLPKFRLNDMTIILVRWYSITGFLFKDIIDAKYSCTKVSEKNLKYWNLKVTMAMLHRALFTWFLLLVFLILLALRLDERTSWNWFIVFIPMWFYDAILLIYISIHMINECRTAVAGAGGSHHRTARQRICAFLERVWPLSVVILKMAFMVALCFKLQNPKAEIKSYHVLLPLWTLLMGLCGNVLHCLVLQHQDWYLHEVTAQTHIWSRE